MNPEDPIITYAELQQIREEEYIKEMAMFRFNFGFIKVSEEERDAFMNRLREERKSEREEQKVRD